MNYRVYYNRTAEFPQCWSVDEGDQTTELNVSSFELHSVSAESHLDLSIKPNKDTPSAWITILYAKLEVRGGVAMFFHDPTWREPPLAKPI